MAYAVTAVIKKCGSKWCLHSKKTGALLGKHDSKKDAMKQEAAIHAQGKTNVGAGLGGKMKKAVHNLAKKLGGEMKKRGWDTIWTFDDPRDMEKFVQNLSQFGVKEYDYRESGPFSVVFASAMTKAVLSTLDDVADELEIRGDSGLAEDVDEAGGGVYLPQNMDYYEQLERSGFDHHVMKRDEKVAEEIMKTDPTLIDTINMEY